MEYKKLVPFTRLTIFLSDATKYLIYMGESNRYYYYCDSSALDFHGIVVNDKEFKNIQMLDKVEFKIKEVDGEYQINLNQ